MVGRSLPGQGKWEVDLSGQWDLVLIGRKGLADSELGFNQRPVWRWLIGIGWVPSDFGWTDYDGPRRCRFLGGSSGQSFL